MMGKTRVSVRRLPNGEKAYHYPPDEEFPEGRVVLANNRSALSDVLDARREDNDAAISDLRVNSRAQVEAKKAAESQYPAVPAEKRFI